MFKGPKKGLIPTESAIETLDQEHIENVESKIETLGQQYSAIDVICSILSQNMLQSDFI